MNPVRAIVSDQVKVYNDAAGWKAAYYPLTGGKRKWVRLPGANTRPQAERLARRLESMFRKNPDLRGPAIAATFTIGQWRVRFDELYPRLSPRTIGTIKHAVKRLEDRLGSDADLRSLTPLQAREFVASLAHLAPATQANVVRHLKRWLKAAVEADIIPKNPFERESGAAPPMDQSWPYIDEAATRKLLKACRSPGETMLIALCRWAGLRRGEAMRLQWADVDLKARRLTVSNPSRVRTTKRRVRVLPLDGRLAAIMSKREPTRASAGLREQNVPMYDTSIHLRCGPVITGLSHSRSGYDAISAVLARAKLTYPQPTHCLRKSRETEWIEQGHDPFAVAKWMGHSVIVAQQHYHRPTEDAMDRAAFSDKRVTRTSHRRRAKRAESDVKPARVRT